MLPELVVALLVSANAGPTCVEYVKTRNFLGDLTRHWMPEKIPMEIPIAESPPWCYGLVRQMGNRDYQIREQATALLILMGRQAVRAVEQAGASSSDPEIRLRAVVILDRYYTVIHRNEDDHVSYPSIWSLPYFFEANGTVYFMGGDLVGRRIVQKLDLHGDKRDTDFNQWAEHHATYLLTKSLLVRGWHKKDVSRLLTTMERRDRNWYYSICPWSDDPWRRQVETTPDDHP